MAIRVTVWHEYRHEKKNPKVAEIYPDGMHEAIASYLRTVPGLQVRTATLDEPDHGLTKEVIDSTDVFTWWGHMAHGDVRDDIVTQVHNRIINGAGIVVLHSGHFSKIFKRLMGTGCNLRWRDDGEREILWVTRPGHPILEGINQDHFVIEREEMYGEFFDIPEPESTFLLSTFTGGEVFRSGMTWTRGAGKVVYFRPGHELFRAFYDPNVLKIIANACKYAAPTTTPTAYTYGRRDMGWVDKK
jgi:trehalose utilization protein